MAESTTANGQADQQADQPQILLQKIYIKDSSFEAPNTPQIFRELGEANEEPQVQLNLNQETSLVEPTIYEVVLTLTLSCTLNDHTAYLAEIHQAGIFTVSGFEEDDTATILGSYCPNLLFPYARHAISSMITDGGFPPFLLQPINFDALYAEQQRRGAEAAEAGGQQLNS